MNASYEMETELCRAGSGLVAGVDEVGRGALAGPLVSAAVILPSGCDLTLRDSKKLSKKQRAALFYQILESCDDFGIGLASQTEIDTYGLSLALRMSFVRALEMLDMPFSAVILDGKHNAIGEDFVICQTKADESVACVAAASILAKVFRDELMHGQAEQFPAYGFDAHVGYGTKRHLDAISKHGPSPLQRLSFRTAGQ